MDFSREFEMLEFVKEFIPMLLLIRMPFNQSNYFFRNCENSHRLIFYAFNFKIYFDKVSIHASEFDLCKKSSPNSGAIVKSFN